MNFRTHQELFHDVRDWSRWLPSFDVICGVPRSGMLAASMLALHRNLPCLPWQHLLDDGALDLGGARCPALDVGRLTDGQLRILVVDDSSGSGDTLAAVRQEFEDVGLPASYGAVYVTPEAAVQVEHFHAVVPLPRVWEWNLFHHRHILAGTVMDIDGILCEDPTIEENDDGPRYLKFLSDARPLVLPTVEVGTLCTNRLERYRPQTEAWLDRHGVRRGRLVMAPYTSQQERREAKRYAEDKAECVLDHNAHLMIESDPGLAARIHALTNVPTFCPPTSQFFA